MPVNIHDIPSEKKIFKKTLSLWIEFVICICILTIYASVFWVFYSEYLSRVSYVFWSELLLVPLLISGAVFFFRIILWDNKNIEAINWNKTRQDYYQELLQKGRTHLEVIELQVRFPDLNGNVTNGINEGLLPVRYAPKLTHMSRYLSFNSPVPELNSIHQIQERNAILFNEIMGGVLNDIHMHISLLPKHARLKVVCVLNDNLKPLMEKIWQERVDKIYPLANVEFSNNLSESIDNWLERTSDEYIVIIAAIFYGAELLDDEVDNKSESVMFLLGRLRNDGENGGHSSLGAFFRPECDWAGIDKSLLWGRVKEGRKLSGIIYSGLNEDEFKKLVLKTTDAMSESALSSYMYVDSDNYLCKCPPLTQFLQLSYVSEHLPPGQYLFVNKSNDILESHLFHSIASV
ncbi:hypothetical protein K5E19_04700 [Enterobacter sp. RIT637]|uniref:hypothetical protein n=1 Tax=Enterobacter sp. RIT637 TaxID=2870470 RepID=UPI001C86ACF9|nr:hypothetical protein [Enterobacter sp. RIT637]MBX8459759.1 hypothetical protein [Enterobacter sp. RIT637]